MLGKRARRKSNKPAGVNFCALENKFMRICKKKNITDKSKREQESRNGKH
jgi:hypothetical protein